MRAMGEMASGIAHDLNNTLVPILGFTETMLEWPATLKNRKETVEMLNSIRDAATDAADMVTRLRRFYRPAGPEQALAAQDLNQLVADTIVLTRPRWRARAQAEGRVITVVAEPGTVRPVMGNADEIREVLVNLVLNAVDALPGGGTIVIRTREEGSWAVAEVRDDGVGMTDEVKRRCFEPFFSTKGEGGTGLGLAMVAAIMRRRNGSVAIESAPGRGTCVAIRFPVGDGEAAAAKPVSAARWKASLRILVVDDEPRVRRLLTGQLRRDRHRVTAAVDGVAALEAFEAHVFDLVITDRVMPGMTGDELADAVKKLRPACPVIMVTALESASDAAAGVHAPVDLVLRKPFSLSDLRGAIAQTMAGRQA
jgi:CheY-like chemotaxis protein